MAFEELKQCPTPEDLGLQILHALDDFYLTLYAERLKRKAK